MPLKNDSQTMDGQYSLGRASAAGLVCPPPAAGTRPDEESKGLPGAPGSH